MIESIKKRFESLLEQGIHLIDNLPRDQFGIKYWIDTDELPTYQTWIISCVNLIIVVTSKDNHYAKEVNKILDLNRSDGIPTSLVQKIFGIISSAKQEWESGFLRQIEYLVAADTFDNFLDHADVYRKANLKNEAAVLASAVLEDTIKKIAAKNGINDKGKTLDPLIDQLVANGVLTPIKGKRAKSFVAVRNKALHAKWEEFDIHDVEGLINGTKELISSHL